MNNATPTFAIFAPPTTRCLFLLLTCLLKNSFSRIKVYPLIFVVWKKKLWKCLLHGKQSNNSEEKYIMHQNLRCIFMRIFFANQLHTSTLYYSIVYYPTILLSVPQCRIWLVLTGNNLVQTKRTCLKDSMNIQKLFCPIFLWKSVKFFISWNIMKFRPRFLEPVMSWIFSRHLVIDKKKMGKFVSFSDTKKVH